MNSVGLPNCLAGIYLNTQEADTKCRKFAYLWKVTTYQYKHTKLMSHLRLFHAAIVWNKHHVMTYRHIMTWYKIYPCHGSPTLVGSRPLLWRHIILASVSKKETQKELHFFEQSNCRSLPSCVLEWVRPAASFTHKEKKDICYQHDIWT